MGKGAPERALTDASPVVIALLPRPADLDRARAGAYRVPLARSPAALARARALLFYQPSSFGAARWRIEWCARIRSLEVQPRIVLAPEEPHHPHAAEPYVLVRLFPLEPLEPPLVSERGRRLLFVPTTWGRVRRAGTLDALLAAPPRPIADDLLYRLIRQQIDGREGISDRDEPRQRRLLEAEGDETARSARDEDPW